MTTKDSLLTIQPASCNVTDALVGWLNRHLCAHTGETGCLYIHYEFEPASGDDGLRSGVSLSYGADDLLMGIPPSALLETGLKIVPDPNTVGGVPFVVRPWPKGTVTRWDPLDCIELPKALEQLKVQQGAGAFYPLLRAEELAGHLHEGGDIYLYRLDMAALGHLSAFFRAQITNAIVEKLRPLVDLASAHLRAVMMTGRDHDTKKDFRAKADNRLQMREIFRVEAYQNLARLRELLVDWIRQPSQRLQQESRREGQILADGARWLGFSELALLAESLNGFWESLDATDVAQCKSHAVTLIRCLGQLEQLLIKELGESVESPSPELLQALEPIGDERPGHHAAMNARLLDDWEEGLITAQNQLVNPETLNHVLLTLAAIKGAARSERITAIAEVASAAESLLQRYLNGTVRERQEALQTLAACQAPLRDMLAEWEDGGTAKSRVYLVRWLKCRSRQEVAELLE